MAVWLNMKGQDSDLCASIAEGSEKLNRMLTKRRNEGALISPPVAPGQLDVHYIVTSAAHGTEEFWLSDGPESKKS
jgi:hypothetical protein